MNKVLLAYTPVAKTNNDDHIARVEDFLRNKKTHYFRVSKTAWILSTNSDVRKIRDALCKNLLKEDTVYVAPIGKAATHKGKRFQQWWNKHS